MSCLGFKGGIGTSSRVTPGGHTVAVVLMTNFGERARLTVDGVQVGRLLPEEPGPEKPAGSCIGVVVTDAPVDPAGCERLARRVGLGLARTGSTAHHGSGEIFLAVSTTARTDRDGTVLDDGRRLGGRALDDLFEAVVDAAEESVLNSLLMSPTTVGRDGNTSEGLDPDTVVRLLAEHGRAGQLNARSASRWRTASSWPRRSSCRTRPSRSRACSRRCRTARTTSPRRTPRATASLRDEHEYAVCRVDLRGTGSSAGDATDEYPLVERTDLCTVIAWLAEQEWCDGNVGMFGTSYSGFNSLQIAAERPPALKAIWRSTPATTGGPTTCTGAATRCGSSTSSTTATT